LKIAVVLFNLGGPDSLEAVRPFLRNLFSDPAILNVSQPFRGVLAEAISWLRAPAARAIYKQIGGRSPIRPLTDDQARALAEWLKARGHDPLVTVAMRYWAPFAADAARAVAAFKPDRLALIPLYPQFSTATTGSSLKNWLDVADEAGLNAGADAWCCYPKNEGFIAAYSELLQDALMRVREGVLIRVLFSAHGLPERIVSQGDPYPFQVEETAKAIAANAYTRAFDWRVSYQSRVGPLKWIGPATEAEIVQAGKDGVALVIVPIAFVSEHSETLVELDIAYAKLAKECGVPAYVRVAAVGTHHKFIAGLGEMVLHAADNGGLCGGGVGAKRLCLETHRQCPWKGASHGIS
jgi:ferrochelatase